MLWLWLIILGFGLWPLLFLPRILSLLFGALLSRLFGETSEQAETRERQRTKLAEQRRLASEKKARLRAAVRDADSQDQPYTYEIGRHGNEALAIRYGIANQVRKVKEYWYYARGGKKLRNPDRDKVYFEPSQTIKLRKVRKISTSRYEVRLSDHGDRPALAIIEVGQEFVKTFYPMTDDWFRVNHALEAALKGGRTFSLKELARLHVEKTVRPEPENTDKC